VISASLAAATPSHPQTRLPLSVPLPAGVSSTAVAQKTCTVTSSGPVSVVTVASSTDMTGPVAPQATGERR